MAFWTRRTSGPCSIIYFLVKETWGQSLTFLISSSSEHTRDSHITLLIPSCLSDPAYLKYSDRAWRMPSLRSILQSRMQELSICPSIGIGTKHIYLPTGHISPEKPGSRKTLVAIILCQAQNYSISGLSGNSVESPWNNVSCSYHPTVHWTSSHFVASHYS